MVYRNKLSDDQKAKVLTDTKQLTEILQAGIYAALLKHKQAGNPVCEWRNNKVVWIAPEDICVESKKFNEK